MNAKAIRLSIAVAVLIALAVSVWQQRDLKRLAEAPTPLPPRVGLGRLGENESRLLEERATLFDPAPIFVPTLWNASTAAQPQADVGSSAEVFHDFPAKLKFPPGPLAARVESPVVAPKVVSDVLGDDHGGAGLVGFGRRDEPNRPRPQVEAGLWVEIYTAHGASHRRTAPVGAVWRGRLQGAVPEAGTSWVPLEIVTAVESEAGDLRPLIVTGSGFEGIDNFVSNALFETLRLQWILGPGLYRIHVGP